MGDLAVQKFWLVPVSGFDDLVALAPTRDKATAAVFKAGKDAGYFDGRDGFHRFLCRVGQVVEIPQREARSRLDYMNPVGAPRSWEWAL